MTKKRIDDRLRVCFPVTPKSSKSCTHSSWLHFVCYKTLTCLLNKSITSFVMKNKVPSCVINIMLSTTTKKDFYFHQETSKAVNLAEIVMSDIFVNHLLFVSRKLI